MLSIQVDINMRICFCQIAINMLLQELHNNREVHRQHNEQEGYTAHFNFISKISIYIDRLKFMIDIRAMESNSDKLSNLDSSQFLQVGGIENNKVAAIKVVHQTQ